MSISPEQQRKKAEAMTEAQDHKQHANVMNPRHGQGHETHKTMDMHREDRDRGMGATNVPDEEGMSA